MIGILLTAVGTFFTEISESIGKKNALAQKESPFGFAFLTIFWAFILTASLSLIRRDWFVFDLNSLPTFSLRAVLEILQVLLSIYAIIKAERSTFGFVRTITIPLLLAVDLSLGYNIDLYAVVGICLVVVAMLVLFINHGIDKKGVGFVIATAINAVLTISLFKYDISHYNSVLAEQTIMYLVLLCSMTFFVFWKDKQNPLSLFKDPAFFLQSISIGLGEVIISFAYNYGAASVITTGKRSFAILWSFLSGQVYFKEKHLLLKIAVLMLLVTGLILLML